MNAHVRVATDQLIAATIIETARANGYRMAPHADSDSSYLVAAPGAKQWHLYRYDGSRTAGVVSEICKMLREEKRR